MKKIDKKIMALFQRGFIVVCLTSLSAQASGITNYETVLSSEKRETLEMLKTKEDEINKEIDSLKKELETSRLCGIEHLRATSKLLILTRYSLSAKEATLHELKATKNLLSTYK